MSIQCCQTKFNDDTVKTSRFTICQGKIEAKYRKSMMSNKNQWWHRNLRSFKAKSSQCLVSPDNNLGTLCNVQRQKQTDRRTPNRIWWNQVPIRRAIYRRFAPRVVRPYAACRHPHLQPVAGTDAAGTGAVCRRCTPRFGELRRRCRLFLPPLALPLALSLQPPSWSRWSDV